MKKFLFKMALAGLLLLVLGTKFVDISAGQTPAADPLLNAWEATSVKATEFVIDGWGVSGAAYLSLTEVEGLGREIAAKLGVRSSGRPTVSEESTMRYYTSDGQMGGDVRAIITVQSSKGEAAHPASTHTGILLVGNSSVTDMPRLRRQVLTMLTEDGRKGETAAAVSGTIQGRVDSAEAQAICSRIVSGTGGKRLSLVTDETGVTLSAYAPGLGASVNLGGLKVNLQAAVRYNPETGQTVVTLASPMLTEMF